MNDIIFNNDIKVTVIQTPEIIEDGDTVEFLATPDLLFATENKTEIENYSFTYIWMVSYDGGLSYQKIGTNTDKLVLENVKTKVFNNALYKVKVVLEDLEDFLLTENGDRILTQIGEILLFNNNNISLSIQTDPVTNNTTVASIDNTSNTTDTPLNFLSIEGTINEALVFDNTITEDIRAEILSLQSKIDINNQAKSIDGETPISVTLPSTPDTDIVLPSTTLGIQQLDCYVAVKKTIGNGPFIQYQVCEPGGYGLFSCSDDNPQTENFNSLDECESGGRCTSDAELVCIGHFVTGNLEKVQFNNIKFTDCIGDCTCCCDNVEKVCDTTDVWNKCEEEFAASMPARRVEVVSGIAPAISRRYYQKYDYGVSGQVYDGGGGPRDHSPPCGSKINCEQEDYVPNPVIGQRFSVSNDCLGRSSGWGSDNLADDNPAAVTVWHGAEKFAYCNAHCKGEYTAVNIPGLAMRLTSWFSYLFYQIYSIGGLWTTGVFVRTYCDGEGKLNNNVLPVTVSEAVIKECKLKVCKQKWTCQGRKDNYSIVDGREQGYRALFSRVRKDGGPSITIDGMTLKSDLLITPNSAHTRYDEAPPYKCYVNGVLEPAGSILFAQDSSAFGLPPDQLLKNCEWGVVRKCCPSGKNCTYKVDEAHALLYPGNYPEFNLDATNRVFDRSKLYSINRSSCLDFIQPGGCKAVCDGEGCEVYEEWKVIDVTTEEIPCNEDFDIVVLDEIRDGHGKDGSEITVDTDPKCVQEPTPAKRTIKIAKIAKRYTYKKPGQAGSYANVMIDVYRRLGFRPGDRQIYINAYLITYEEKPVSFDPSNIPTDSPYIKIEKRFEDGEFYIDSNRRRRPKQKLLYRHSSISLVNSVSLNRECDQCKPLYLVSNPSSLAYPCNDRNYVISGCVDETNNPLPAAYGECLKDNSSKTTPIRIVTVTEIKEPTREMLRLADAPNTDYFKNVGAAKAEALRRVGSTGIVCSGASI